MAAIPKEQALALCEEIRKENRGKWYTYNGLWCWGCATFTRGNADQRCFAATPDHRGCAQVNRRWDAKSAG